MELEPNVEEFIKKHGSLKKFMKLFYQEGQLVAMAYYAQLRIKRHRQLLLQKDFEKKFDLRPL